MFQLEPAAKLQVDGVEPFDIAGSLIVTNDLPVPDWSKVGAWIASIPEPEAQARAWSQAEMGWLAHLQRGLGEHYHLAQHEHAIVLSTLEPRVARATVEYMTKTLTRVERVLEGIAKPPEWGRDILLVFEDEEAYYRYVSRYYAADGEFSVSGGMHINFGCSHFATCQAEMRAIEPVIAHEMTHACLAHLPIPAWLNEGLAVNTERRLSPPPGQPYLPQQLHLMHQRFWNPERIQEFWLGTSFMRPDDGNLLSYELGRILVENFAADWERFKAFVLEAQLADAGAGAAESKLGIRLGAAVCSLFGFESSEDWEPQPAAWSAAPERGAFRM